MSIAILKERPVAEQRMPHEWERNVTVKDWLRSRPIVARDMGCGELANLFRRKPELECVVVGDELRRPLGLIMKHRFFRLLGSTFGMSLYANKTVSVMTQADSLAADSGIHPRELIDRALSRDEETFYDAVIITENGKYAGILTVSDLLHMSRMLQRESSDRQIRTVRGTEAMIRDIHHAVEKVVSATEESREGSERIAQATRQGRSELEGMLRLFRQWTDNAERQERAMEHLKERTAAVNQIAVLIADLADQCNLLAVNAAIEAARAGEQGRGFGVVAGEIRSLADGTKRSAGEINRMLKTVSEAVAETVQLTEEGKQGADQGVVQVHRSEETFARLWDASELNGETSRRLMADAGEAIGITNRIRGEIAKLIDQLSGR